MSESFLAEEVAIVIRARQILKSKGLSPAIDVSGVCKAAGVSRKTGYKWAEKHLDNRKDTYKELEAKLVELQCEHDRLRKENDRLGFENRAHKLAWEINRVDELLAGKKSPGDNRRKKKR